MCGFVCLCVSERETERVERVNGQQNEQTQSGMIRWYILTSRQWQYQSNVWAVFTCAGYIVFILQVCCICMSFFIFCHLSGILLFHVQCMCLVVHA